MIDIELIRNETDRVKKAVASRNDSAPIDEILALDKRRREILGEVEELKRERNQSSKSIGQQMGQLKKLEAQLKKGDDSVAAQVEEMKAKVEEAKTKTRQGGERINELDGELRQVDNDLREKSLWVPNLPHESTPVGADESANKIHPPTGAAIPEFDFEPKPHWELGEALGILDFEQGIKLSGSRFYVLKGWGSRLQRAVISFMLDHHRDTNGYTEIYPPFMVRSRCFETAGQLPKFHDNIYRDAEEDFMFLATAEVALTNLHADEIVEESQLPLKYVAYTPCWRREKMSHGKDVRGIKRGHQFDKVEIYQLTHPEESEATLEMMKAQAAAVCEALGFPYRILELATGDLSYASIKTYDIEVWAAGCQEWLEVSSASNCTDFQARRAGLKFRPGEGGKSRFVHTLNASGLALPRVMIAILENNQQADGSVIIPEVLRPYLGGAERIPAPA